MTQAGDVSLLSFTIIYFHRIFYETFKACERCSVHNPPQRIMSRASSELMLQCSSICWDSSTYITYVSLPF